MGVHGLWKLIESAGKPVPVETLENKVVAVDVSIWLHQLMKGYQNPSGSSVSNAYLLGLFTRVCKLLFTKVKPVFVFDGGVPQLKKKTIVARQQQKHKAAQASEKLRQQLLKNLLKQKAVSQVLEEIRGQTSPKKKAPDMFELPPLPEAEESSSDVEEMSNGSSEEDVKPIKMKYKDLHSVDVSSEDFKSLPADMRHDILTELKETRKQNSWGRIHEMPEESGDFSKYQMSRLLKRRSVQVSLEEAEKEMGGRTLSLGDVEALMAEGGIEINPQLSKRIASDEVTRYIYVTENREQSSKELPNQSSDPVTKENHQENSSSTTHFNPNIKIKEEIIDSDELSDVEFVREIEAIEAVYNIVKVEKDENYEYGTEEMFEDGNSSEGVIVDEMDLVKDNSGLSQDQILAIIKQENVDKLSSSDSFNENIPSTSKKNPSFQESLNNDVLEVNEVKNKNSPVSGIEKKAPSKEKVADLLHASESNILDSLYFKFYNDKIQSALSQKSKIQKPPDKANIIKAKNRVSSKKTRPINIKSPDISALASDSSSSDSENSQNLPCQIASVVLPDNKNNVVIKSITEANFKSSSQEKQHINAISENDVQLSSSESDNDFVDVTPSNGVPENNKNMQGISIEIQTNQEKVDNDIFADIFSEDLERTNDIEKKTITTRIMLEISKENPLVVKEKETNKRLIKNSDIENTYIASDPNSLSNEFIEVKQSSSEEEGKIAGNFMDERLSGNIENIHSAIRLDLQEGFTQAGSEDSEDIDDPEPKPVISSIDEPNSTSEIPSKDDNSVPRLETSNDGKVSASEPPKRKLNMKQLEKLQDILETKERDILLEQNREDRIATSMTDQMYQEAQELLRLFGVPYVVAPMEAEAQCAFMDAAGLTQGTITDDSDIWLFGGRKVYKNFFDQKKFVLEFKDNDIKQYFKLDRHHLILLALLVGSDYTVGLQGVGPVTALEILATFPPPTQALSEPRDPQLLVTNLLRFRDWWQSPAPTHAHTPLAKKLKNIELHQGFPSPAVVSAYLQPMVDDSREPFSWGTPDLPGLRDYAEKKFGWSRNRVDQILLPVVNRLSQKTSQMTLHTFFGAVPNITAHQEQMSRRVQSALHRLEGGSEDFQPLEPRSRQPRGRGRGRARGVAGGETAVRGATRGRGRGSILDDDDSREFVHESVGKAPEVIPQREKDRQEALKRKQQAIEVLKKKKSKLMKKRKNLRQEKQEANLSESSSDD